MKLASLRTRHADGELILVSSDLSGAVSARDVAPTMRYALENWAEVDPALRSLAAELEHRVARDTFAFMPTNVVAPLPRPAQWLDGSVFRNHGRLLAQAFGVDDRAPDDWPLMYQGLSDYTLAPTEDVPLPSEADGIDFEGEFAAVVDEVPMGVSADEALSHIKLMLLANDWSLRAFGPAEMRAGFGFIRAKPATAFAPVAVTTDELGAAWKNGRVCLDLHVHRGDEPFGHPNGHEMAFHFGQLIAHASYNRRLSAGTVIGSGTVSNSDFRSVGSACIAERRSIEVIDDGLAKTPFLRFGERVRMQVFDAHGRSIFGAIDQQVVSSEKHS
jgi:fumarylacetoacetate (FAA) hydrolase